MLHVSPTYPGFSMPEILVQMKKAVSNFLKVNKEIVVLLDYDKNRKRSLKWKTERGCCRPMRALGRKQPRSVFHLVDRSNRWWFFCAEKDE